MITICPFENKHVAALAAMMMEMTRFYGAAVSATLDAETTVSEQAKNMDMLLALHDGTLAGFATFKDLVPG